MTRKPRRVKTEAPKFEGRRPTINDVARLARVSKKTVSRIINKSPFVKEKTRERVEALIKELGYTPDPMARGLASKRSFLVGLIYDQPNPQYVIDMQQGILDVIRGSGFELLVHPCRRQARVGQVQGRQVERVVGRNPTRKNGADDTHQRHGSRAQLDR